jgi:hypothetical protein
MQRSNRFAAILAVTLIALSTWSVNRASDDDTDWPEDDGLTDHVNEGELEFLAAPPAELVHHHSNVMTLGRDSLVDGWVRLDQCHSNIDNVGRAQIIFRPGRIRGLRITASENIGRAWVEESSVQLTDIGKGSSLCLAAETRALTADDDGGYRIDNGPFMRRFLDGYYPMRVSQKILLADSGLTFFGIRPSVQPGFEVTVSAEAIDFDAWFEGRLLTEVQLVPGD